MPSEWNMFVKKVFEEGRAKNPNFSFGEALKEASARKNRGEMGNAVASGVKPGKMSRTKKANRVKKSARRRMSSSLAASASLAGGKSRRHRRR